MRSDVKKFDGEAKSAIQLLPAIWIFRRESDMARKYAIEVAPYDTLIESGLVAEGLEHGDDVGSQRYERLRADPDGHACPCVPDAATSAFAFARSGPVYLPSGLGSIV